MLRTGLAYPVSCLFLILTLGSGNPGNAQQTAGEKLLAGPMLGYVEYREAAVWMEVAPSVESVSLRYWQAANPADTQQLTYHGELGKPFNPVKLKLRALDKGTEYRYQVRLDGEIQQQPYPLTLETKTIWRYRTGPPDISFLFGSCSYVNDSAYDRPGEPYGQDPDIFKTMGQTSSDFMLWGGDNIYLRPADWHSRSGIHYRNAVAKRIPEKQRLMATRPNYAIWDDHDYGPNNSNRGYYMKEATLQAFKAFWANKTYGEPDNPGIYTKIQRSDADFFLMDNRSYRSPKSVDAYTSDGQLNPNKDHYGEQQLQWLKDNLSASEATFKVIVTGGEVLNDRNQYEGLHNCPAERQELLGFIREAAIEGVVFLSGDRHMTELLKREMKDLYPLYNFTCSPFTAGTFDELPEREANNPYRVDETLVKEQNFAKISLQGDDDDRKMVIEVRDKNGDELWEREILAEELTFPGR